MADVTFTPNLQPAPACYPADVNQLLNLLTIGGGLIGTVPDNSGGGIFVGSIPPSSSLTNKVWFKIDTAGRPLGVFMFYNGNWRQVYTGSPFETKFFTGNPESYFDSTGRGVIGLQWDGWAICNGQNGTPDLRDRFVVGANAWDDSFGWETIQNGTYYTRGGQGEYTLTIANFPNVGTQLHQCNASFSGSGTGYLSNDPNCPISFQQVVSGTGQHPGDQPIPTLPPFVAMAPVMFVGYQ